MIIATGPCTRWQLVVDETHSLGVLGIAGKGACDVAGLRVGPAPGQVF